MLRIAAAQTIRNARQRSGMTQAELAERLGTSQAAIAQLESPGSNPTVATLERVLYAAGHELELEAKPTKPNVDLTLIARQLRMTPAERLAAFEAAYHDARELFLAGARARGEVA
jgi:transcriptional regulator with XRE-family HTH domain